MKHAILARCAIGMLAALSALLAACGGADKQDASPDPIRNVPNESGIRDKVKEASVTDETEFPPADGKKTLQDLANAGPLSIGIPGAVRGYVELLKRWGKRPLRAALAPAISLAANGFQVTPSFVFLAEERRDCLAADPDAARIFLRGGESGDPEPLDHGDKLTQPDLARTLQAIGLHGAEGFYKGPVAARIVESVQAK